MWLGTPCRIRAELWILHILEDNDAPQEYSKLPVDCQETAGLKSKSG